MKNYNSFYVKCNKCLEHVMIEGLDESERGLILSQAPGVYDCYVCRRAEELKTADSLVETNTFA